MGILPKQCSSCGGFCGSGPCQNGKSGKGVPTTRDLAAIIARGIMQVGDDRDSHATRIQFKGGKHPDERDQGGLCEASLVGVVYRILSAAEVKL